MRALVFRNSLPRLAATRLLGALTPRAFVGPTAPIRMEEIPDPALPADDWLVLRTRLCGLCGSDYKQVFLYGCTDNPMTDLISWPQVLGHEVVGTVERMGPAVRARRVVGVDQQRAAGPPLHQHRDVVHPRVVRAQVAPADQHEVVGRPVEPVGQPGNVGGDVRRGEHDLAARGPQHLGEPGHVGPEVDPVGRGLDLVEGEPVGSSP